MLRNGLAEGGLRLRIRDVVGGSPLVPNSCRRLTVSWRNSYTGQGSGAVFLEVETWADAGKMRVRLALPGEAGGKAAVHEQVVCLEARDMPRGGGVAWLFVCPRTRNLCTVLHCPRGVTYFAGRRAFRLSYLSQRRSPSDRPRERARKIRMALGGSENMLRPFPSKPKRMHWRTYDRLRARAEAAEGISLAATVAWLDAVRPGWRDQRKVA